MTITWDPWHTVTVTAVTNVDCDEDHDDYELVFTVEHPHPHENGCPENCMTQQAIDEQCDSDLPTGPGVYQIRAWGDYFPGNLACEPDWDGGVEVKAVEAVSS